MTVRSRLLVPVAAIVLIGVGAFATYQLPAVAAGGLLYPSRRESLPPAPHNCADRVFKGDGVTLHAWDCRAQGSRRGTVIYLHGTADNRGSGVGVINRYTPRGFDVVAYDSRRHGASGGEFCTYGYFEKRDLTRVIDAISDERIVLFGTSLGAAVALQEAAHDDRVRAVIAAEVFSSLESIARDRAPRILTESTIRKAFQVAEATAGFRVAEVSPVDAARSIKAPVLLIHGANDRDTPAAHSELVFAALQSTRRLIVVDGAGHNQSLSRPEVWTQIDEWIDRALNQ